MKTMTCKQLGGACDKKFSANTFDELADQSRAHGMEMMAAQDADHMKVIQEAMQIMQDPAKMEAWINEKIALFESLPED
jgi:hypothetical protein